MYQRRCEADERVLLVREGGFAMHMVRYTRSYSTVTLLARFLGLSTSNPLETLT